MKHWFKKSAAIAMSAVMALSLAACASRQTCHAGGSSASSQREGVRSQKHDL